MHATKKDHQKRIEPEVESNTCSETKRDCNRVNGDKVLEMAALRFLGREVGSYPRISLALVALGQGRLGHSWGVGATGRSLMIAV